MRIANVSLISGAQDMSQSIESSGFYLGHIPLFSIHLVFTGSPNGTFKLQCSNDRGTEDKTSGGWSDSGVSNWNDIPDSQENIVTAGSLVYNVGDAGYRWVRVIYTFSSGTGSLTSVQANAKGI